MSILFTISLFMMSCSDDPTDDGGQTSSYPPEGLYEQKVFSILNATASGNYADGSSNTYMFFDAKDNIGTDRPLIIIAPGGGYYRYTKEEELRALCQEMARYGYATALIRYSIESNEEDRDFESYIQVMKDIKSAVQYFKMNAEAFRIDPDNVFIGGWSSGAHLASIVTYLEEGEIAEVEQELPRTLIQEAIDVVGFDGVHTNYSSEVKGCILLFTYIVDVDIIDAGEPALMMINHEDAVLNYSDRIPVIREFHYNGIDGYGTDLMEERAIAEGFESGKNLRYIKSTEMTDKPNESSLDPKYYPQIANFLYNNMD